jgi:hypothetical protein
MPIDQDPTRSPGSTTTSPPEPSPPLTSPPASGEVTVTGTVVPGVETGCLLVEGYLIIDGDPAVIQPGRRVRLTGRVDHGIASYCQQGIPLLVVSAVPA